MRELNLVPQTYSSQKKSIEKKKTLVLSIVALVLLMVGAGGYIFGKEALLKMKRNNLQNQVDASRALVKKNEELVRDISLTKQHIEKAKELSTLKEKDTDGLVSELSTLFPEGVKITSLTFSKQGDLNTKDLRGTMNIGAEAASKSDVQHLWANLRESDKFRNSHISGLSGEDKVTFNLTIEAGGVKEDAEAENKQ